LLKDSSFPWVSGGSTNLLGAARRRLLLWDITEDEIKELERESKAKRALTIYSPVSGVVTERAAYHHGRQVTPEMDLYTIVDLSTVWVLGEIQESDLPYIRPGQVVQVEFPYSGGMNERAGRVAFISPLLNGATRTAQMRVEFANPDLTLLPDMFVDFQARVPLGARVAVPEDAVMDTGTEQYVFVDKGQGYFEPRAVKLGPEAGGYYAIESGLQVGEMVVTAANFVLDSESRLKGAFAGMGAPAAQRTGHEGHVTQEPQH
jgi:RND family efflux transporter MFP subunit